MSPPSLGLELSHGRRRGRGLDRGLEGSGRLENWVYVEMLGMRERAGGEAGGESVSSSATLDHTATLQHCKARL